ncbi:TolC family protein [Natronincola ferrireducens]|uniref:Outer membrane efflux protein n=1 Tax=Natronincola ferrireducens TaxID=393762 RepID=A0A1G8X155_9FIRM|nr:TolC family protein [Natronincola ferrireducens]SDJ84378.1 Outer membrane efflux protein [Natronincola ferrireducens]
MGLKKLTILTFVQLLILSIFAGNLAYSMDMNPTNVKTTAGEETLTYSYDELLRLALNNSSELRRRKIEVERSEIMREEAARAKKYTPVGHGGTIEDAMAVGALRGLLAADINLEVNKRQLETEEDKLAYEVLEGYNKLLLAKSQLNLRQKAEGVMKRELTIANLRHSYGQVSSFERMMAEKNYHEAVKQLDTAKASLEAAFLELNNLAGLSIDLRYELAEKEGEEKTLPELEAHIRKMLNDNPNIWALEQRVKLAELAVNLYTYNVGDEPFRVKEMDVSTAKLTLNNSKEIMENSLRSLYQSLEQMEKAIDILEINLEKARENLGLTELRVELGMAIPLEVQKLEKLIAELDYQLLQSIARHEEMSVVYEKPWVVSGVL